MHKKNLQAIKEYVIILQDQRRVFMALIYIGNCGARKVFITPYSQKRLEQRNLSFKEAVQVLEKRDVSYPADEDGRQKIRAKIGESKDAFLVILEDSKQIIIITGGES